MATIRERGPFQWQAQVLRKGQSPQYKTFNNKADAERWSRQVEAEMDRGIFVSRKEAENTTLSDALDRYEQEVSSKKKGYPKEKDKISYWKTAFGSRYLATIRPSDLASWRDKKLKDSASSTVNRLLNLLSHVFTVAAQDWGMEGLTNPVFNVRRPKNPLSRERRLLSGELDRIYRSTDSPSIENVIRFAIETGMRRGEIAAMTWDNVNLKKKVVYVPESKTGESRSVPLSPEGIRILSFLPRRIDGQVWSYDKKGLGITRVFQEACKRGRKSYEKDCDEKGIKPDPPFLVDLTFHDLRHEATSRFFEKGLNPMQVAAITGHKTLQMLKRYTHLKAEDLAELLK